MQLFHTSPAKIEKIDNNPTRIFGDCLFFSSEIYQTGLGDRTTYSIDADDNDFVTPFNIIASDELIEDMINILNVDAETALEMLTESGNTDHLAPNASLDDYEIGLFVQKMQGKAAKEMGYLGCESIDEQGTVYIIPMNGKEGLLVECQESDGLSLY